MGFKLIAQLTLIVAAVVILLAYIQPSLLKMKDTQDELFQYSEAVSKASQFNARLRELIQIRDSFSPEDLDALEKFLPTEIDTISIMRDIEAIFASRGITVASINAEEMVGPVDDIIIVDSPVVIEAQQRVKDLSYQDFNVSFIGSYEQLREILALTEMSDSLLEVTELSFGSVQEGDADDEGDLPIIIENEGDRYSFSITYRTYALPVKNI